MSNLVHHFRVSDGCQLRISIGDLTQWSAANVPSLASDAKSAVVNAANETLLGGGGVDGAIHRAAGPGLLAETRALPERSRGVRCRVGEAVLTAGHRMAVPFIIHTVGPRYFQSSDPAGELRRAYRSCLELADSVGIEAVAFPALSCGVFRFPPEEAAELSLSVCLQAPPSIRCIEFVLFSPGFGKIWTEQAIRLCSD